uniref:Zinc knuckle CX2CX4HX4C domain-containing protein n=1 Tax=Nelumbo nucifera TaxID=4432 RepID=A0A822XSS0_NELNU|nr:TPA_asm: hypothetical protein HUJ06_023602 [Nelumbo nucifera]
MTIAKGMQLMSKVGNPVRVDTKNINEMGLWERFLRVQVEIDITKSLPTGVVGVNANGEKAWFNFQYERLATFCYFCGVLGHEETRSYTKFDLQKKLQAKGRELLAKQTMGPGPCSYGPWLLASQSPSLNQILPSSIVVMTSIRDGRDWSGSSNSEALGSKGIEAKSWNG